MAKFEKYGENDRKNNISNGPRDGSREKSVFTLKKNIKRMPKQTLGDIRIAHGMQTNRFESDDDACGFIWQHCANLIRCAVHSSANCNSSETCLETCGRKWRSDVKINKLRLILNRWCNRGDSQFTIFSLTQCSILKRCMIYPCTVNNKRETKSIVAMEHANGEQMWNLWNYVAVLIWLSFELNIWCWLFSYVFATNVCDIANTAVEICCTF